MAVTPWKKKLIAYSRKLNNESDAPIWWQGFAGVIVWNETSCDDDNPYLNERHEAPAHAMYKAGAEAAESLLGVITHRYQ